MVVAKGDGLQLRGCPLSELLTELLEELVGVAAFVLHKAYGVEVHLRGDTVGTHKFTVLEVWESGSEAFDGIDGEVLIGREEALLTDACGIGALFGCEVRPGADGRQAYV